MTELQIGVGDLAHFIHRRGDLYRHFDDPTTAIEGTRAQQSYQAKFKETDHLYETEVFVSRSYEWNGFRLKVDGRIDGLRNCPTDGPMVEEIKATRISAESVKDGVGSTHIAQAKLYAGMLEFENRPDAVLVRLTYVNPDTKGSTSIDDSFTVDQLDEFFTTTCNKYLNWIKHVQTRVNERNRLAKDQQFPFSKYNPGQYLAARHIYRALRGKDDFLWEAATGTGKTISTLFPALKAMGTEQIDRVVFITARNTGQRVARENLDLLHKDNPALTYVNVSAKQEMCLYEGEPCNPETCEYAKGYYDRMWDARERLLERRKIDKAAINNVARTSKVCPFELSLDAAEWADVVLGDYNYVFDPRVSLQRLHSKMFDRVTVFVDEAHRLTDRVSEMLSCSISTSSLQSAIDGCRNHSLVRVLDRIKRFIESLRLSQELSEGEIEVTELIGGFWSALDAFVRLLDRLPDEDFNPEPIQECIFELIAFQLARDRVNDNEYMWVLAIDDAATVLSLRCLIPKSWISAVMKRYHSSIRFSGTLSPAPLINELHGLDGSTYITSSRVNDSRFGVFVVPDISTYYRDRVDTKGQLANLLAAIHSHALGNWLIAFPSFEYMQLVWESMADKEGMLLQQREMTRESRDEFIEQLEPEGHCLAFVVMGGIFTESVDIDTECLTGVVVVGPGIPPQSVIREKTKTLHHEGYEVAYRQPAMTRVIQAAGRVVRNEADRGVVVLVDPRFTQLEFSDYFPRHWNPQLCMGGKVAGAISEFWRTTKS